MNAFMESGTRKTRDAGQWIKRSSKTGLKRLGETCMKNALKCSGGLALAGYTAVNMAENSKEQQHCIASCLPPNWTDVVRTNGTIEPQYFSKDQKSPSPEDSSVQPQCTEGVSAGFKCEFLAFVRHS